MKIEQDAYDNVTSLFYCVVIGFPILVTLEFLFYYLYQSKVFIIQTEVWQYFFILDQQNFLVPSLGSNHLR